MKNTSRKKRFPGVQLASRQEKGVALVTVLLLLTLLSAVTVGMVIAASSDELVNGYYKNVRSSFYAADSGLNIVRQAMLNQLDAAVPATITDPTVQPITPGTEGTVLSSILSTYSSNVSVNSGQAANSWPGKFRITEASLELAPEGGCTVSGNGWGGTCASPVEPSDPTARPTYTYIYNYSLKAVGSTQASEETTLTDRGKMQVTVPLTSTSDQETSFAAWGMFIDQFDICSGSYLVPGTISGPVFTNGAWTFGVTSSTNYIFTDAVGSVSADFGYEFGSQGCYESPNDPYLHKYKKNGKWITQTIDPDFQGGHQLGQAPIPLPENDFDQKQAVLDGVGDPPACAGVSTPCPTYSDMNSVLRKADSTQQYPSGGASSGVFMPYTMDTSASCLAPPCMTGGGIYVEGDASVTLTASNPTTGPLAGHSLQVVTIVQSGVTSTVTIDLTNNETIFQTAGDSITIDGVPSHYGPTTKEAAMVYVNGDITSIKGPGSGNPAIQDGSAMTVTSAGDMTITDDIIYKTKPVTTTQDEILGTPPSTIIPEADNGQVLGLFTSTGDIRMENCSGCGSLEIDASIATISEGGSGGLVNTGNHINTLTIIGGRIQNNIKNINASTRNVVFDRRFSQGNFAPPWFPSTEVTLSGVSGTDPTAIFERVQWVNQTPF